jgi:hypothetical protein
MCAIRSLLAVTLCSGFMGCAGEPARPASAPGSDLAQPAAAGAPRGRSPDFCIAYASPTLANREALPPKGQRDAPKPSPNPCPEEIVPPFGPPPMEQPPAAGPSSASRAKL